MKVSTKSPDEQAMAIEAKLSLLAYLRSGPQHLSIESYLCLTSILSQAGWHFTTERWSKDDRCLSTIEAAIMELEQQVASERDRLLRRTVKSYATRRDAEHLNNITSPK